LITKGCMLGAMGVGLRLQMDEAANALCV